MFISLDGGGAASLGGQGATQAKPGERDVSGHGLEGRMGENLAILFLRAQRLAGGEEGVAAERGQKEVSAIEGAVGSRTATASFGLWLARSISASI